MIKLSQNCLIIIVILPQNTKYNQYYYTNEKNIQKDIIFMIPISQFIIKYYFLWLENYFKLPLLRQNRTNITIIFWSYFLINFFIRARHKITKSYTQEYIVPKYRIVTVTNVTICGSVLWRLKAVTIRLVLESFKSLVLASSFWDFLWRPAFTYKIIHTVTVTNVNMCDDFVTR
jgi:hypothetical protein